MDYMEKLSDKRLRALESELTYNYTQTFFTVKKEFQKVAGKLIDPTITDPQQRMALANKHKRLESLLKRIALDVKNTNITMMQVLHKELVEIYGMNFNWGAYLVEGQVLGNLGYPLYNRQAIANILLKGETPFYRIAINELKDVNTVYKALYRGFAQAITEGKSIKDIAKVIQNIVGGEKARAIKIARTENTRIMNEARLDSFKFAEKKGFKTYKVWIATNDKRTRDRHRDIDGQKREIDKPFSNGLMQPGGSGGSAKETVNCRCSMTVDIDLPKSKAEIELDEKLKNMSYDKWQNERKVK